MGVLQQIISRIETAPKRMGFLDCIFGDLQREALDGAPTVLYGAGSLGQELCAALRFHDVHPVCFCDKDAAKIGTSISGIPVIGFEELQKLHKNSLVVISTKYHLRPVRDMLVGHGFSADKLLCQEPGFKVNLAFLYAIDITQLNFHSYKTHYSVNSVLDRLKQDEERLIAAYNLLADQKSRDLFVAKLAFLASDGNLQLFAGFIIPFSEPFQEFGFDNHLAQPEDYYYFNNDVFAPEEDEVYVDVGAFNGDTIETFVQACERRQVAYRHILAFEPDPQCYRELLHNTSSYQRLSCHQIGLAREPGVLKFTTSANSAIDQAAAISDTGDTEIQVVALDDFLQGERVSFIKMDPSGGGQIIPDAVKGAARTIALCKPKLALGAYHAIESIYEVPLLVHSICPDYRLYLRHNTYHLCDTDLYATV